VSRQNELDMPTIAPELPMKNQHWNSSSAMNVPQIGAKLACVKLNAQFGNSSRFLL